MIWIQILLAVDSRVINGGNGFEGYFWHLEDKHQTTVNERVYILA